MDIPLLVRKDRSGSRGGCFPSPQVTGLEISFGIAVKWPAIDDGFGQSTKERYSSLTNEELRANLPLSHGEL